MCSSDLQSNDATSLLLCRTETTFSPFRPALCDALGVGVLCPLRPLALRDSTAYLTANALRKLVHLRALTCIEHHPPGVDHNAPIVLWLLMQWQHALIFANVARASSPSPSIPTGFASLPLSSFVYFSLFVVLVQSPLVLRLSQATLHLLSPLVWCVPHVSSSQLISFAYAFI